MSNTENFSTLESRIEKSIWGMELNNIPAPAMVATQKIVAYEKVFRIIAARIKKTL